MAFLLIYRRGIAPEPVVDLAGLGAGDRLLDIGCGPGTLARAAARRCAAVVGVDPSPEMIRVGRVLNGLRRARSVRLVRGSAEHLPVANGWATVVWALRSVHHWEHRHAGLAEAYRVLAPRGRLLLLEPLVGPGEPGGFTREEFDQLVRDVEAAGFVEVTVSTVPGAAGTVNVLHALVPER